MEYIKLTNHFELVLKKVMIQGLDTSVKMFMFSKIIQFSSKSCNYKHCTYHLYQMPYSFLVGLVHQDMTAGERKMDGDRGYSLLQWQHYSVHPG